MNALNRVSDARTPVTQLIGKLYRRNFLSKEKIKDQRHLVIGIGGLGSILVQLLNALGAEQVDVLCAESAADLALELGAKNVARVFKNFEKVFKNPDTVSFLYFPQRIHRKFPRLSWKICQNEIPKA